MSVSADWESSTSWPPELESIVRLTGCGSVVASKLTIVGPLAFAPVRLMILTLLPGVGGVVVAPF